MKTEDAKPANETPEVKPKEPDYQMLFDFFLSRYEPTELGPDVLKKTTAEIFELFQEHCPLFYTPTDVYQFLSANNFKFETPGGNLEFVWLLKYKHPVK